MSKKVIEVLDLSKSYRDRRFRLINAVKDVTFDIEQGEAFGFIGPNGAGKSTTIKMLTGIIRPTAGQAKLFGQSVDDASARFGMSYVPENPYLYDYLTPLEILKMGVAMQRLRLDDVEKHCMYWLDRFDIAHAAKRRIRGFSKGMTQRTALAHALACKPRLMILDEPLSGLDPVGRKDVVDVLVEYRQQGGAIFFSSHVLHDVERLADRFGLIHKGELRTVRHPHELIETDARLVVRTIGDREVEGMQREGESRWRGEFDQDMVWDALERLHRADHRIMEIKPTMDLERTFMTYVGR
ncbi:MAG: ABC transporter ATP-binding protein [Burkholderiales bacterium]|nr:ABC transporter ATP-binding protein [Burkholderiales bacterium]